MNKELLAYAMEVIDAVPEHKLDLKTWQQGPVIYSPSEITCGTVACAGGWLTLTPRFQELGLKPDERGFPQLACLSVDGSVDNLSYTTEGIFNGWILTTSARVFSKLFDISLDDASDLFEIRALTIDNAVDYAEVFDVLTDRQLWLSRARNLLHKYESK